MISKATISGKSITGAVFRWVDERLGISEYDYPVPVYAHSILYSLGALSLASFVLLSVTGLVLLLFTSSQPESARDSLIYLFTRLPYGNLVRGVHFWAANLMVVTTFLHLLRVFWTGSFKKPRELQWMSGVFLFTIVVLLYFTGTVVKWDQVGYEALVHNQDIVGLIVAPLLELLVNDPAGNTSFMTKLYRFHTIIFPAFFALLLLPHIFMIRSNHISPVPQRSKYPPPGSPNASSAEASEQSTFFRVQTSHAGYAFFLMALVGLLALVYPPGIGPAVIEGVEITRPAWVFWYSHAVGNQWGLVPLTVVSLVPPVLLFLVPFIDRGNKLHILDRKWMAISALILLLLWVALTAFVGFSPSHQHIGL